MKHPFKKANIIKGNIVEIFITVSIVIGIIGIGNWVIKNYLIIPEETCRSLSVGPHPVPNLLRWELGCDTMGKLKR